MAAEDGAVTPYLLGAPPGRSPGRRAMPRQPQPPRTSDDSRCIHDRAVSSCDGRASSPVARPILLRGLVNSSCPTCGIAVEGYARCPLCDASLVEVNLRRLLLWAFVVGEYCLVLAVLLRFM